MGDGSRKVENGDREHREVGGGSWKLGGGSKEVGADSHSPSKAKRMCNLSETFMRITPRRDVYFMVHLYVNQ